MIFGFLDGSIKDKSLFDRLFLNKKDGMEC
jgi:hypothetical protein